MSDISLSIVRATAGSAGKELSFNTTIDNLILAPNSTFKIGLDSNLINVNFSIELVSGVFDGSYDIENFGYSTTLNNSLINTATFVTNPTWNSSATFKIIATFSDQQVESNEFTINSSGTLPDKTFSIDLENSVLTGLDNSLQDLEVLFNRSTAGSATVQGQQEYIEPGSYSFTVPEGVTSISAVAISGGGAGGIGGGAGGNLAYNTFSVTPGESLTIQVGAGGVGINDRAKGETTIDWQIYSPTNGGESYIDRSSGSVVYAAGGAGATVLRGSPQTGNDPNWLRAGGGNFSGTRYTQAETAGQTLYRGGSGGVYSRSVSQSFSTSTIGNTFVNYSSAGGGAAGYAGQGGNGAPDSQIIGTIAYEGSPAEENSGGGGGGSTTRGVGSYYIYNGAGGGVGIYGLGADGAGGTVWDGNNLTALGGRGGSSGNNGTGLITTSSQTDLGRGGSFGGGGAGIGESTLTWNGRQNTINQNGGDGAVRLIWGDNRSYPSTNVGDVEVITQADLASVSGTLNDTPAFKVELTDAPATTSLPRTVSAYKFKRSQETVKVAIPIQDDPEESIGSNIGEFTLTVSDLTDGYTITGDSSVSLTVNTNPNPPVREIYINEDASTLSVNQGNNFEIDVARITTRNGQPDLIDSITLNWTITTVDEKFIEKTGTSVIDVDSTQTTIVIQTSTDFSTSGAVGTGTLTINSATSNIFGEYTITNGSIDLEINDIYKVVEIVDPSVNIVEITEGETETITIQSLYEINGVEQLPEDMEVSYSFLNKDSRITNSNGSITLDSQTGLGKTGVITIDTTVITAFQDVRNTIFRLDSATNGFTFGDSISKTLNIIDSSNQIKNVSISSNDITAEEGDSISVTIKRVSTADDVDNYDDGGVSVAWRIIGDDTRYSLTSGVAQITGTDREVVVTIPTLDTDTPQGYDIISKFEIYSATNDYTIVSNASEISITLIDNDPFYQIVSSTNFVNEGDSVSYTISGRIIPNGTQVYPYIKLSNGASLDDFTTSIFTRDSSPASPAAITVNNNSASYNLTVASDVISESGESFEIELWSDISPNGKLLARSNSVTISNEGYTITSDKVEYNEGDVINLTIESDLANGTTKTFTITGIQETDVTSISGSGSWNNGVYTGTIGFERETNTPLQKIWTNSYPQSYVWTVPEDAIQLSAVAVGVGGKGSGTFWSDDDIMSGGGGGALAYSNNLPLSQGEEITVLFETDSRTQTIDVLIKKENGDTILKAQGGFPGRTSAGGGPGGQAQSSIGTARSGSSGRSRSLDFFINSTVTAGGGGAASYDGNKPTNGYTGVRPNDSPFNGGGGGIGLLGTTGRDGTSSYGRGKYGGNNGATVHGGRYGGGGGQGTISGETSGVGQNGNSGDGAVRIMWTIPLKNPTRRYPDLAEDVFGPTAPVATSTLTIELAEDLSINEGREILELFIDNTTAKLIPINDTSTSVSPTYTATPAANNINEGSSLTINVETTNVADATTLYWTATNSGDFNESNGSFIITSNTGSFTVTPTADLSTEDTETFQIQLRTGSVNGTVVDTTDAITINDTSTTPAGAVATFSATPAANNVDEGSALTINVETTNVTDATTLYWTVNNSGDFGTASGSFTITSNTGSFTVTPTADSTTEGAETFTISIRIDSVSGTVVDTTDAITINDTSAYVVGATSVRIVSSPYLTRAAQQLGFTADSSGDNWVATLKSSLPGEFAFRSIVFKKNSTVVATYQMAENEAYAIPRDDNNYDGSARFFPEDNSSDDRVDFVLIYDGTASDPIANEISPLSIAEGGFNRIEFWTGTPGVGSLTQFVNFTANN